MCKFRPHGSTCLSRRKSLIFRLQCCAGWRAVQYRKSFLIASHFNFLVKAYVLFIFGFNNNRRYDMNLCRDLDVLLLMGVNFVYIKICILFNNCCLRFHLKPWSHTGGNCWCFSKMEDCFVVHNCVRVFGTLVCGKFRILFPLLVWITPVLIKSLF